MPLAPLWAYMLFTEVPAVLTVIGGSVIFLAVLYSQYFANKQDSSSADKCDNALKPSET
ncbi:MAG: hypothetical protein AAF420_04095 [Pseudomonadota bacterium]